MTQLVSETVWRDRLRSIDSQVDELKLPQEEVGQDSEWCEVVIDGERRRVRFHDYDEVFNVPGLYEELFYERLECCSPSYITRLLEDVVNESGDNSSDFRVLDVGAGNGMVGDELRDVGVENVVGVDIIPEAREATKRDRPGVYDEYRVVDLTDLSEGAEKDLRKFDFNCLTTVAALGFGDIPALAFAKALDLINTPGWVAFNLKEDFLHERDESGFSRLIRQLNRDEYLQTHCYRRYRHRLSIAGEPLYYVAVVAQKLRNLDDKIWDWLESQNT